MDPLQLRADFDTAQALANAKELAQAIRDLKDASNETGRSQNALATSTEQASKSGQAAGNTFNQLNAELNISNSQTLKLTENVKNVSNATYKYTTNIKNVHQATKDTGQATSSLIGQVQNLVGAYFGMQRVIKIFDDLLDRYKQMADATKEMGGMAFDDDKAMMRLANRTGLGGELGVAHMRKIRGQIVAESGATPQMAAQTMQAAMDAGIDLNSANGLSMARDAAKFAQRRDLDQSGLTQFLRGARLRGATNANGLNDIIAKTEAAAQAGGLDVKDLIQNQDMILSEARNAGLDQDYASSLYAALVGETSNPRRARSAAEALIRSVSSQNKKGEAFFAHRAAAMGVTKVAGVSDGDVESILSQSKEGKEILLERQKLALADQEHAAKMRKMRRGGHLADINNAEESYLISSQAARDRVSTQFEDIRTKELARRELAAYGKIGATDRIERVIGPTIAGMSISDYQANSGVPELDQQAQQDLIDPTFAGRFRGVLKGVRSSNRWDAENRNQDYFNSQIGQTNAAIGRAELDSLNQGKQNGGVYLKGLEETVKARYRNDVAIGKYLPQFSLTDPEQMGRNIYFSQSQQLAEKTGQIFQEDIQKFIADNAGTPEAQAAAGLLKELQGQESNPFNFFSANAEGNITSLASDFGTLQMQAAQRKGGQHSASSGGSFGPSAPATRPTTQPSPQASAVHYHTHIGNYWAGGDDDFEDLPGRLERDA